MNNQSNQEVLAKKRHSLAHLLAEAVRHLYPNAKNTIGPATDEGFYYDFDFGDQKVTETDLKAIEKMMLKIKPTWQGFTKIVKTQKEAEEYFKDNEYKLELIKEIAERGEEITFYQSGDFIDLCRGGHVDDMSEIAEGSFALERIAGAYWRGNEKNKMLTRIYGLAFETKQDLADYLTMQAEAKKRDHRKLGKELEIFTLSDLVGSGLPMFKPNGAIIRRELENFLWDLHKNRGYDRVWTPHLAKEALYEVSGHAGHYMDDMFSVWGGTSQEKFYVKPMNCPHHYQIFADTKWSYRDMPVRYFEPATVYRDEKTGQLSGLTRVRSITQDDGHLFVRADQLHQEIKTIVDIIKEFYTRMEMINNYRVRLSLRGEDKENYMGSDEVWEKAEQALRQVCESENLPYFEGPGEAAFYGPKLDFIFKDAIGRDWQLATVQCDFNAPVRFDLSFTNDKGEQERPIVIHRAISGSLERFIGLLIEHFAGAFPFWLAPTQVAIIPVNLEAHLEKSSEINQLLISAGFRTKLFSDNDSLGKRVRNVNQKKIPYQIVVGDTEIKANLFTLEGKTAKQEQLSPTELINYLQTLK